ncbi:hypothetical protein YPC_2640 [Yersinia pestis biovar Medievalis str. Harbin 35]|nr:hypothetical protein YPC_2640 [Yersinia pestis biovar Medievalis str. Harbin 35]
MVEPTFPWRDSDVRVCNPYQTLSEPPIIVKV